MTNKWLIDSKSQTPCFWRVFEQKTYEAYVANLSLLKVLNKNSIVEKLIFDFFWSKNLVNNPIFDFLVAETRKNLF